MMYAHRMLFISLCIAVVAIAYVCEKTENNLLERPKTMNNQNSPSNSSGSFNAKDKKNNALTLNWHILTSMSAQFVPTMNQIADLASQAFTSVEFDFLQAHPEAVAGERLYQSIAPLFQNNASIDWPAVKARVYTIINQLYTKTDWSKFGTDDQYIIVTAHDQESDALLGFITFFIRPAYSYGDCKVTAMGIIPQAQNRGLGKLLMSSIFKIIPETKRIFLTTRVTNEKALAAYRSWGFNLDANPLQEPDHNFNPAYWIFMEYKAAKSDVLQETAKTMN
jgi:ribosomal protein S18 acetylase RimI-like enzyme